MIAWDRLPQEKRWDSRFRPGNNRTAACFRPGNSCLCKAHTADHAVRCLRAKTGKSGDWSYDCLCRSGGSGTEVLSQIDGDGQSPDHQQIILRAPIRRWNSRQALREYRSMGSPLRNLCSAIAASRVLVMGGKTELPPTQKVVLKPVLDRQPVELAEKGKAYYDNNCAICHGQNVITSGHGRIKDLRNIRGREAAHHHATAQILRGENPQTAPSCVASCAQFLRISQMRRSRRCRLYSH